MRLINFLLLLMLQTYSKNGSLVKLFCSQPHLPGGAEAQNSKCLNQMRQQEPREWKKPFKALLLVSFTAELVVGVDVNLMSAH